INEHEFISKLERALFSGIRIVQIRADELEQKKYLDLAEKVTDILGNKFPDARFFLNTSPQVAIQAKSKYLHLKSGLLRTADIQKQLSLFDMVSASVHNEEELELVKSLSLDFVYISPVLPTASHPKAHAL